MNLKIALNNFLEYWFPSSPKPLLMTKETKERLLSKIESLIDVLDEDGRKRPASLFVILREIVLSGDETALRNYVLHDDFIGAGGLWDTYLENKYRLVKYQVFFSQLLGILQYIGIDNTRIRFIKDKVGHGFLTSYKNQLDDDMLRLGYPERKESVD